MIQELARHYDSLASRRDDFRRKNKYYYSLLNEQYRYFIPEGKKILEIGCGTGDLLAALRPLYGMGVDISPHMIELARGKYPTLYFQVGVIQGINNEKGNIERAFSRTPLFGTRQEFVFVEGHSKDGTYEEVERVIKAYPHKDIKLFKQQGKGKGDAVRFGFAKAQGEVLMILDADLTVSPEEMPKFYEAIQSGKGEFINGCRLIYPMEDEAMRFLNLVANKSFGLFFSWLLGQRFKDTLCGTKVMFKHHYNELVDNRHYFGDFDPFGDFDLIFGSVKLNLKVIEMPIRYKNRTYGTTQIQRFRHGLLLLKMCGFAMKKIKFI